MSVRDLIQAWLSLVALSFGTVLLATTHVSGRGATAVAAGVLVLAGVKARVILARYLGLAASPFWTRVFDLAIGSFLVLAFALYAFGSRG